MRNENPMVPILATLKVNGIPAIIKTHKQREQSFNAAKKLEIEISTRKRIGADGFEVHRVK